jgi:REP element-mobilizing transposase RayT
MAHTRLLYHIVSATHRRYPWLRKDVCDRLYRYISGICRNMECPLTIAGGVDDHIHLFAEVRPTICIAEFVRDVKACSSRFIHETFPDLADFAWQVSYSASARALDRMCEGTSRLRKNITAACRSSMSFGFCMSGMG